MSFSWPFWCGAAARGVARAACRHVRWLRSQALLPLFADLPKATIASIVAYAVSGESFPCGRRGRVVWVGDFAADAGLIHTDELRFMWRVRAYGDLLLFLSMYLVTVVLGITEAVAFAFAICLGGAR